MQKISSKKLWLVVLIFALPMIASWLLYHYHAHFSLKTLNHGTLVKSPIDVNNVYAQMENGTQKKWRIMYVSDTVCDAHCQQLGDQLARVQQALGKDHDRVLVLLMKPSAPSFKKLQASFVQQGNTDFIVSNKVFLVDPLGNLFMYYPSTVDPMAILKDVKRVLEVSQIG